MNSILNIPVLFLVVFVLGNANTSAQTLSTIAGTGNSEYNGENKPALLVNIDGLSAGLADSAGNIYFVDNNNHRIRKISLDGKVNTICGTGLPGFNGDNIPAISANIANPTGFAFDRDGNLLFADFHNNRVRKIDLHTGLITTIAGCGKSGWGGNGRRAVEAELQGPSGVAVDANGNIYISDCDNNTVRKVDRNGIISLFAGNNLHAGAGTGFYGGDGGQAVNASLNHPKGLTIDAKGNLLIADCFNHRIRKVTPAGIITTVAGNGNAAFSGDKVLATATGVTYPYNIATAADGTFYFTEPNTNVIRKVDERGYISVVAGNGSSGFSKDGVMATGAAIKTPTFLYVSREGDIVFGANGSNRIRKVSTADSGTSDNGHHDGSGQLSPGN